MEENYNETYLDSLIAEAKNYWEGVDVESYMKNVRDMKTETIRCRELQILDWITDEHGFPMQITNVGEDYAYATFVGLEGDPWEFDDKDDQPQPIPITPEILEKNGFKYKTSDWDVVYEGPHYGKYNLKKFHVLIGKENITLASYYGYMGRGDVDAHEFAYINYVHELQRALRCCGLWDMADNFKV